MTKNNRKAAYVDFNQPEYQSLSDEEVQLVKKAKLVGDEIKNCHKHGLHTPVFVACKNGNTNYGCLKCIKEDESNF